jgi:hypothetical protein
VSTRRRLSCLGLVGLAAAGLVGVSAGPSQAFDGTFQATSAASGVRVSMVVPHAPLSDRVADFGGPVAQTVVDSIGESSAYASFPFPGAGPATSPALVRGASGGKLPAPDYPLFVSSKAPANPKQQFGNGPLALQAESSDQASTATATVGLDGGGGTALGLSKSHAESGAKGDGVSAVATSETTGFSAGPLQIARVVSKATTTFGPDGKLTRAATTVVEGASVGGTPVVIDKPDLGPVNQLLAQAKIQVDFAPKQEVDTGVTAPMLRITQHDDSSGATIIYQIGEASAFVDAALPPSYAAASPSAAPDDATPAPATTAEQGSATEPSPSSPEAAAPVTGPTTTPTAEPAVAAVTAPVRVPVGFVVPGPSPVAEPPAAAAPTTEPAATRTIQLAQASRPAGVNPAARLLISTADPTPAFLILTIGAAAGLVLAGFLGRRRTARG